MAHRLKKKRYFTNNLCDYDNTATEEAILSNYKSDLLQEIDNVVGIISKNVKPDPRAENGGLYVGLSGIAYGLFYASQSPHVADETRQLCLSLTTSYLKASLEYCSKKSESRNCTGTAFLLGHLGVYAFAAVFYSKTNEPTKSEEYLKKFISLHKMCKPVDFLACGGDELLVGRAGYLCGVLYLQQQLGDSVIPGER